MKLLIVSQYFSPEHFIINDIVLMLVEQGHEVVVATGKPNYPDGKIFPGYRAWGCQKERYLDVADVLRVPLWPRGKGGGRNLFLNYLSFVVTGLMFFPWMLRKKKIDAILVFGTSPITQAIPAIFLKWLKRVNLAVWVQDLWPESLAATGFVKKPLALKVVGAIVRRIYSCCDQLLVQSEAFVGAVAKYAHRDKIVYYPNSINSRPGSSEYPLPPELLRVLDSFFCVVFAGNLGTAQSLETLLQAAVNLCNDSSIRLVLVGSGSRLEWLKAEKEARGLDNLILPGRFPAEAMPEIFARSGALLVSLNDEFIFNQTIPSKVQAYLAAGKPIIGCLNGEGARIIQEAGAGISSPAEQVLPLVAAIREMHSYSIAERDAIGASGRAYFDRHFDMEMQVRRLAYLLQR